MLLHRIALKNLLSFGPEGVDLELRPLNVFIGPNGSGKSNLIEAISLLQAAPRRLADPVREGGGISDWLWKGDTKPGAKQAVASVEATIEYGAPGGSLTHQFQFSATGQRFELLSECITPSHPTNATDGQDAIYSFAGGQAEIRVMDVSQGVQRGELKTDESILSLRKGADQYPEITYLGNQYEEIRLFREWSIGRDSPVRFPQKADRPNDFLAEDYGNLGLVLNQLEEYPDVKSRLREMLTHLYPDVDDYFVKIVGSTVQVFLREGKFTIPATRLSDGTLRYLCLLAILCHPDPPPLICIEEPELGLHPDVIPAITDLLRDASQRTQLLVTTHSDMLVDDLTSSPEDIVVCEKLDGQSQMNRLDADELQKWLKDYSLGELWISGQIGGKRW